MPSFDMDTPIGLRHRRPDVGNSPGGARAAAIRVPDSTIERFGGFHVLVDNTRFRAALFDPDLAPAEAAGAPVAWSRSATG